MSEEIIQVINEIEILLTTNVIQLLTAIASLLAVSVGLGTLIFQYKSFQKQRKPIIRALLVEFNNKLLPKYSYDWETNTIIDRNFSNSTITLVNHGGTAANIDHFYYLFKNYKEIEQVLNDLAKEDEFLKIEPDKNRSHMFDLLVHGGEWTYRLQKISSYTRRGTTLKVDQELEIPLPSYFLVISNYLFNHRDANLLPELTLVVKYSDMDMKVRKQEYTIKWDNTKTLSAKEDGISFSGAIIPLFQKEVKEKASK